MAQEVEVAQQQLALLIGLPERSADLRPHLGELFRDASGRGSIDDQTLIELASSSRPSSGIELGNCFSRTPFIAGSQKRGGGSMASPTITAGQNGPGRALDYGLTFPFSIKMKVEDASFAELEAANYNRELILIKSNSRFTSPMFALNKRPQIATLSQDVLPKLLDAMSIARKSFEDGGMTILVLQTTAQYVDSKRRMLEQSASACRAEQIWNLHAAIDFQIANTVCGGC
ncbi:MAG: hypothetical protein R3C03_09625 [Pirellulaceae bacterium]